MTEKTWEEILRGESGTKKICTSCNSRQVWDVKAYLCWTCENSGSYGGIFTGREE